jgi:hypothetical protein
VYTGLYAPLGELQCSAGGCGGVGMWLTRGEIINEYIILVRKHCRTRVLWGPEKYKDYIETGHRRDILDHT